MGLRTFLKVSLKHVRFLLARCIRSLPFTSRVLNLPKGRVKSLKVWAVKERAKKGWAVRMHSPNYSIIYPSQIHASRIAKNTSALNIESVLPCPACVPNKRFVYWDKRSGFDSKNGLCVKPFYEFDELFLAYLPKARIIGPDGIVITSDNRIVEESIWVWDNWLKENIALRSLKLGRPGIINDPCYSLVTIYSEGYPHWLLEVLPRLNALDTLQNDIKPVLIFNKELNSWQKDSLAGLGFDKYPTFYLNNQSIQCDHLFLPSYAGLPGTPHPNACKWVRDKILNSCGGETTKQRIYISRKYATKRKILNEDELLPILEKYGFGIVFSEHLGFKEQVKLFAGAEAVVAAHGAGLGNLLFVPKGCKVLEILDRNYVNDQYYNLSVILNLDYYYFLSGDVNPSNNYKIGWEHFAVNPVELEKSLSIMFPK